MTDAFVRERVRPLSYFFSLFLLLGVALGGISSNDTPTNAILQFLALPPLIAAILFLFAARADLSASARFALALLSAALVLPLLQLLPLPLGLAQSLPLHSILSEAQRTLGAAVSERTLSLARDATLVSVLSTLPGVAAFLFVATQNERERSLTVTTLLLAAILSAFVGLLQLSQNSANGFYLYPAGPGDVVGFFANRNHFAALIYGVLPFSVAWIARALDAPQNSDVNKKDKAPAKSFRINYVLLFCGVSALFVFIVVAIMARSRAGVVLLMLALFGVSFLPRWRRVAGGGGNLFGKLFLGLAGFSLLFALEYGFFRLLSRFEADPLQDARFEIAKNTWALVLKALPTGTGLGSFQKIYAAFEPVRDIVANSFINRAHNDYLEFALEGGVPAILLILAFLIWIYQGWRDAWSTRESEVGDAYVRRAASLTIVLLLLHAAVDYALRTHAVMLLFAASCALLLPVIPGVRRAEVPPVKWSGVNVSFLADFPKKEWGKTNCLTAFASKTKIFKNNSWMTY
jgi:O-antigen ligase